MKPATFDYHRPDSVDDAARLLAELGEEAKILAGGQSLVPMLSLRLAYFDHLIDISRLAELKGIERQDGMLWVGAGTTDAAVGADAVVRAATPLLSRATPLIGHFQIRSRGTLGGSIAHADPAAEYPAVALALDAEMEAVSTSGRRRIGAKDFFTGLWETALAPEEVLVGVRFPVWDGRCGYSVHEFARRHGDFAIAGAVVAIELDADDRVRRCGIGLMGLGSTPRRAHSAEKAVLGQRLSGPTAENTSGLTAGEPTAGLTAGLTAGELTADEIGELAMTELDDVPADLQGSASYRKRVGAVMVARSWAAASTEARNA